MTEIHGSSKLNSTNYVNVKDGYKNLMPLREIKTPVPMKQQQDRQLIKLNNALLQSPLNEQMQNNVSLKKLGFMSGEYVDMNGGKHYTNNKGDHILIAGWNGDKITGPKGSKCVSYTSADKKIQHEVVYDPDGNPLKGILIKENDDGSKEQFKFEYDINGEKTITSYCKVSER